VVERRHRVAADLPERQSGHFASLLETTTAWEGPTTWPSPARGSASRARGVRPKIKGLALARLDGANPAKHGITCIG